MIRFISLLFVGTILWAATGCQPVEFAGQDSIDTSANDDESSELGRLLNKWRNMDPEAATSEIETAIEKNNGTPLNSNQSLLFLVKHDGKRPPRLVGDFNEWAATDGRFAQSGAMNRIGETSWYSFQVDALPRARFEYAVQIGQQKLPDPRNPRIVETFGSSHSEVVMQGAKIGIAGEDPVKKFFGEIQSFEFVSTIWNNTREIFVYLPPNYDETELEYPTLFVLDGGNWLEHGRLDATLDKLIQSGKLDPIIAVFVPPVQRAFEYGGSSKFRQLVTTELIPEIQKRYRTSLDLNQVAILGVSRGGLAALDLAFHEPQFGYVAVLAPAIKPLPFLEKMKSAKKKSFRVAVTECAYDLEQLRAQAQELRDVLENKQYDYQYEVAPINHSYNGWRHHVEDWLVAWKPTAVDE